MKTCTCGRVYTAETWSELPLVGYECFPDDETGPEEHLEYRNCVCQSTLLVGVPAGHRGCKLPSSFTERDPRRSSASTRGREQRSVRVATDEGLTRRAQELARRYLPEIRRPYSIRWVMNMNCSRWGSCTPSSGAIRISHRLREVPDFVRDATIVHELAHLLESSHNDRFWSFAERYPRSDEARAFLRRYNLRLMDPEEAGIVSDGPGLPSVRVVDAKPGDVVVFGVPRGEQTRALILDVRPGRDEGDPPVAYLELLERRGRGRGGLKGDRGWRVKLVPGVVRVVERARRPRRAAQRDPQDIELRLELRDPQDIELRLELSQDRRPRNVFHMWLCEPSPRRATICRWRHLGYEETEAGAQETLAHWAEITYRNLPPDVRERFVAITRIQRPPRNMPERATLPFGDIEGLFHEAKRSARARAVLHDALLERSARYRRAVERADTAGRAPYWQGGQKSVALDVPETLQRIRSGETDPVFIGRGRAEPGEVVLYTAPTTGVTLENYEAFLKGDPRFDQSGYAAERDVGDVVPFVGSGGERILGRVVEVLPDAIVVVGDDDLEYRIPQRFQRRAGRAREESLGEAELETRARAEREQRRQESAYERAVRSERAAEALADRARMVDSYRIEVSPADLFGDLLSGSAHQIVFALESLHIAIPRQLLVRARSAVRPFARELGAWIDTQGVHLRWRRGLRGEGYRGGLDLRAQPIEQGRAPNLAVDLRRFPIGDAPEPMRRRDYWTERDLAYAHHEEEYDSWAEGDPAARKHAAMRASARRPRQRVSRPSQEQAKLPPRSSRLLRSDIEAYTATLPPAYRRVFDATFAANRSRGVLAAYEEAYLATEAELVAAEAAIVARKRSAELAESRRGRRARRGRSQRRTGVAVSAAPGPGDPPSPAFAAAIDAYAASLSGAAHREFATAYRAKRRTSNPRAAFEDAKNQVAAMLGAGTQTRLSPRSSAARGTLVEGDEVFHEDLGPGYVRARRGDRVYVIFQDHPATTVPVDEVRFVARHGVRHRGALPPRGPSRTRHENRIRAAIWTQAEESNRGRPRRRPTGLRSDFRERAARAFRGTNQGPRVNRLLFGRGRLTDDELETLVRENPTTYGRFAPMIGTRRAPKHASELAAGDIVWSPVHEMGRVVRLRPPLEAVVDFAAGPVLVSVTKLAFESPEMKDKRARIFAEAQRHLAPPLTPPKRTARPGLPAPRTPSTPRIAAEEQTLRSEIDTFASMLPSRERVVFDRAFKQRRREGGSFYEAYSAGQQMVRPFLTARRRKEQEAAAARAAKRPRSAPLALPPARAVPVDAGPEALSPTTPAAQRARREARRQEAILREQRLDTEEWWRERPDTSGMSKYVVMVRGGNDPERRQGGRESGDIAPHLTLAKTTPADWEEPIRRLLADGAARTFNRISVELIDKTADITSGEPPEEALWRLVERGDVEYTPRAPVYFRITRQAAARKPPRRTRMTSPEPRLQAGVAIDPKTFRFDTRDAAQLFTDALNYRGYKARFERETAKVYVDRAVAPEDIRAADASAWRFGTIAGRARAAAERHRTGSDG